MSLSIEFLAHSIEEERNQSAWELWKELYPLMAIEKLKFITFEDYKKELYKPKQQYSDKTFDEIEKEMQDVISAYEGR